MVVELCKEEVHGKESMSGDGRKRHVMAKERAIKEILSAALLYEYQEKTKTGFLGSVNKIEVYKASLRVFGMPFAYERWLLLFKVFFALQQAMSKPIDGSSSLNSLRRTIHSDIQTIRRC